jgi:hypothetical protein
MFDIERAKDEIEARNRLRMEAVTFWGVWSEAVTTRPYTRKIPKLIFFPDCAKSPSASRRGHLRSHQPASIRGKVVFHASGMWLF